MLILYHSALLAGTRGEAQPLQLHSSKHPATFIIPKRQRSQNSQCAHGSVP